MNEQMNMSQVVNVNETVNQEAACLQRPAIQDFIQDRHIHPEDLGLIVSAFDLPREVYIENHNTINLKKGDAGEYFEYSVKLLEEKQNKGQADKDSGIDLAYARLMHEFCTKYDWATAWNMNSLMEKEATKRIDMQS